MAKKTSANINAPTPKKRPPTRSVKAEIEKQAVEEKLEELKTASKVVEEVPSDKIPVQRSVEFYKRPDVVSYENRSEKHLVRYLGVERYWSLQQIEICLRDLSVTLVVDGSLKDPNSGRFLEFPEKTQVVIKQKERKPCIGCGR